MDQNSLVNDAVTEDADKSQNGDDSSSAGPSTPSSSSTSRDSGPRGPSSSPSTDAAVTSTPAAEATDTPHPPHQEPPPPREEPRPAVLYVSLCRPAREYEDYRYTFFQSEDGDYHFHVVVVSQLDIEQRIRSVAQLCEPLHREPRFQDVDESDDENAAWEAAYRLCRQNWRPVSSSGGRMSLQDRINARHNYLLTSLPRLIACRSPEYVRRWVRRHNRELENMRNEISR